MNRTRKQIMKSINVVAGLMVVTGSLCVGSAWSAPIVFSGSGAGATTALDAFRAAIGGVKNTAAAPQVGGRREINWDGVKLDGTDVGPNTVVVDPNKTVIIDVDRFKGQGTLFADPYAVSGDGFTSVNPASAGQFPAFSPNNIFAMQDPNAGQFDDRFIGESFNLAGSTTAAGTPTGAGRSLETIAGRDGQSLDIGGMLPTLGGLCPVRFQYIPRPWAESS